MQKNKALLPLFCRADQEDHLRPKSYLPNFIVFRSKVLEKIIENIS